MEDKTNLQPIDGFYFESVIARFERMNTRLVTVIVVLIILLFASNIAWLYVWNGYEYSDEGMDVTVGTEQGNANYLDGNGDINNGLCTSSEVEQEKN